RDLRLRLVEIWRTLLEEGRERFLGVWRTNPLHELLAFTLDSRFELAYRRLLEEPLARQQRVAGFCRQLLRRCGGGREQIAVGHNAGYEAKLRRPRGREGLPEQIQFRRPEVADARRYRKARSEFRHQRQVDERQLEFRALDRVDEIAVRQHRGSTPDSRALHGRDDRLFEPDECVHQVALRKGTRPGRILEEIHDVVAGAEHVPGAVPEHDVDRVVLVGFVEDVGQVRIHGGRHRVLLGWEIKLDPQDRFGTPGDNFAHRLLLFSLPVLR